MTNTTLAANDEAITDTGKTSANSPVVFNMPEAVMPNMWLTDYDSLYCNESDGYWEPPIDRGLLANLPRRNPQHGGIMGSRVNMAASRLLSGCMTAQQVEATFTNQIMFGDVALLKIRDGFGRTVRLFPLPSYRTRVAVDGGAVVLEREDQLKRYKAKDIIWVRNYDPVQQVYGLPDYIGGMQAAMLGEDATMFRRKYFLNGAHMGFIMYATDPNLDPSVEKEIKDKIQQSKGVGNFKSLFVNIPNGKEKGLQIIPVGNFESKDEFGNVKSVAAQDVFNAHRFPAGLGGMIPTNAAGFGDPIKYGEMYFKSETKPLINRLVDAIAQDPEIGGRLKLEFDLE